MKYESLLLPSAAVYEALSNLIVDDLVHIVKLRGQGHRIQVTDLPSEVLEGICKGLRAKIPECEAFLLSNSPGSDWIISSTKLIELRNTSKKVIVIFVPPTLRTSAEDSFALDNFERYPTEKAIPSLLKNLRSVIPPEYSELVERVMLETRADDISQIRYLLALEQSSYSTESIGLALVHLGLIPDSSLPSSPIELMNRLTRNREAVDTLSNPRLPTFDAIAQLGLKDPEMTDAIVRFMNEAGSRDPSRWLMKMIDEKHVPVLAFDHWVPIEKFMGTIEEIEITDIGTTGTTEDGHPLLDLADSDELKVTWATNPVPTRCEGLDRFSLELIKDDVAVSSAKIVKRGSSKSGTRNGKIQDIISLGLSDGLYNVRVRAWAEGNTLLLEQVSTSFWIRTDIDIEETPPPTTSTIEQANSLAEAYVRSQVKMVAHGRSVLKEALPELAWNKGEKGGANRFTDILQIQFSPSNIYEVQMNSILVRWEEETLADVKGLGRYEALTDDMEPILRPIELEPTSDLIERFLDSRKMAFDALRSSPEKSIVETDFMAELHDVALGYINSYLALLDWASKDTSRARSVASWLLNIDSVKTHLDSNSFAYLIGPTHPLKFSWAVLFSDLVKRTCSDLTDSSIPTGRLISAISRLTSLNLPYSILTDDGEPLINVDNIGPYWSIFIPAGRKDIRADVAKVRSSLGSGAMDDVFTTLSSRNVFVRVARYLSQHPYVKTLFMNIVQPGSGSLLVDMLLELQNAFPEISYRMNLFAQENMIEEMGAALDDFMAFDRTEKGTVQKDELLAYSKNALFPKFTYSKHSLKDFIDRPEEFEAHITVLFDVFHSEVRSEERIADLRSSYMGGLLHEFVDSYLNKDGNTYWRRQVLPGLNSPDVLAGTMVDAYRSHDRLIAMTDASTAANKSELVPTVLLNLGPTDKNLISLVHEVSDWVFTIDRNFGLEYLDDPYDIENPVYVIDQEPDQFSRFGHRFFISTSHLGEADRIVRPVLKGLGLPDSIPVAESIVYALRSSSSRLLLKLLSSTQASRGALGMAFARLYMERSSTLKDMLLIPLDSHTELLRNAKQDADARGNEIGGQRTDLLLVELGTGPGMLRFHLVEVKFRSDKSIAALEKAKSDARDQLDTSFQALRQLFDPKLEEPDRVDRPFLTHELIGLLNSYLERAIRYQLIPTDFEKGLYALIDRLESGYALEITKNAFIFSLDSTGLEQTKENDISYHIIGKDKLIADLDAASQAREKNLPIPEDSTNLTTRTAFTERQIGSGLDIHLEASHLDEKLPKKETTDLDQDKASSGKEEKEIKVVQVGPEDGQSIDAKVIIGANNFSPQMGILGKIWNGKFALDLNTANAISVFGVQGSGKSYTLGSIIEMSLMRIPNLNVLKKPLGVVVFHYSDSEEYAPEILSIIRPNGGKEAEKLEQDYEVTPKAFIDVTMLVPESKLEQRQNEYPGIDIRPILFDPTELDSDAWHYLMGVTGNDAMYVRIINNIIKRLDKQNRLNLDNLWSSIVDGDLDKNQERRASDRLEFAKEYIRDGYDLSSTISPGRLVVVDLRDKYIKKADAIGIFMVIQKVLADRKADGIPFNKLFVFDEAHNYIGTDFVDDILSAIRLMRHKGNSIIIASQDPMSVPSKVIELSSVVILHKMIAPNWLKHIKGSVAALGDLAPGDLNMLRTGQAYIWASVSNSPALQVNAVKVEMRPRVTKHGGETVKAVP